MKVSKDTKRKVTKLPVLLVTFKNLYFDKRFKDVYRDLDIAFPTNHVHSFASGNISSCFGDKSTFLKSTKSFEK